jgi:predicted RNA binding protein YcfA (HicA-like mRNA interferase family)
MSKRQKLLERIRRNPKNVSFRELRTLLDAYGFELKRTRGSHYSFVVWIGGQSILLVIPYQQSLQAVYVKKALDLIERIEAENAAEEDEVEDDE